MFYHERVIGRSVTPLIEQSLAEHAAVAIIGPRQVGKTTLTREIADKPWRTICCPAQAPSGHFERFEGSWKPVL